MSATTGAAPGAGAAAFTGGDEDHVGVLQRLFDLGAVVLGGLSTDLGVATGAESPGEFATDVELQVGLAQQTAPGRRCWPR